VNTGKIYQELKWASVLHTIRHIRRLDNYAESVTYLCIHYMNDNGSRGSKSDRKKTRIMESIEKKEKVVGYTSTTTAASVGMDEHDVRPAAVTNASDHTMLHVESPRLPENDIYEENYTNLSLLDPARYGWMAIGGVADLLTPHEVRWCWWCCFFEERTML
jgi:hypothetical protein